MSNPIPTAAIDALVAVFGKGRVLHTPEDLLVFEYDGTIERGSPQVVVFPDSAQEGC